MSRFVDREDTATLDLGPCACPGTPHESDWVKLRKQLSGGEWVTVIQGNTDKSLALLIVGWNLCDDVGPVDVNEQTVSQIDLATFKAIDDWIAANVSLPQLPNASGAPSRNGSRGSASRTRTTPRKGSPTTRS